MAREPELVDIACTLKAETEKAWLLDAGTSAEAQWVPKSQVENSDDVKRYETGVFVMPMWLAKDKGFV
jgi:hypothetical protein